jgi:hypothetical protein
MPAFELRVPGDVDFGQLELELGAEVLQRATRPLAEVAARSTEEDDPRRAYGYSPRVVVASATRWTARP